MLRFLAPLLLLLILALPAASAPTVQERPDLETAFRAHGVEGTFVLYDVSADRLTVVNRSRAERRFRPASTFKIVNTLIGLETGAVRDVDEVLPYGGQPKPFKAWERDMSMREAIRLSAVPIYQEVARRVGRKRMDAWVERLGYGNRRIGGVVDRFWLDGPLETSAVEQARWVARLARGTLPASRRSHELTREILKLDEQQGRVLYGKTGWEFTTQVGWWTGWVQRDGKTYAFSLNMEMPTEAHAPRRLEIGRELLRQLDVW